MSSIASVLAFSWIYIRRYWVRLVASILLGMVFALANASFIWAAGTLSGRWEISEAKPANHQRRTKRSFRRAWPNSG